MKRVITLFAMAFVVVAAIAFAGPAPPAVACGTCDGLPPVATMIFNCAATTPAPWTIKVDLGDVSDHVSAVLSGPDHTVVTLDTGATIGISWALDTNATATRSAIPTPTPPTRDGPTAPAIPDLTAETSPETATGPSAPAIAVRPRRGGSSSLPPSPG